MPNEPNISDCQIGLRMSLELSWKVRVKYGRPGDRFASEAFVRALEEVTQGVALQKQIYDRIAEQVRYNRERRRQQAILRKKKKREQR